MRVPAAKAGTVKKLFDFECNACAKHFEDMATKAQIDANEILCTCGSPAHMILSAARVDSHAAASWRR